MGYGPWGHKELDTTEHLHLLSFSFLSMRGAGYSNAILLSRPKFERRYSLGGGGQREHSYLIYY